MAKSATLIKKHYHYHNGVIKLFFYQKLELLLAIQQVATSKKAIGFSVSFL